MVHKTDTIDKLLDRYVEELKKDILIDKIILFGSYAKKQANDESDIDIAVISRSFGIKPLEDFKIVNKVLWRIDSDRTIQVHAFNPTEFEEENFFTQEILRTGITIYENTH